MENIKLLQTLLSIPATSGEESGMKEFILEYVAANKEGFAQDPVIVKEGIQDNIILVFGTPSLAVFAHMDTVGFSARYNNELLAIGGVQAEDGYTVEGKDTYGTIVANLRVSEEGHVFHDFPRAIQRGTRLHFFPDYVETEQRITAPYLDNRIGVWTLLQLAHQVKNCALVFSTYEEHGGGSVPYLCNRLYGEYKIDKSLICDVTWATEGVHQGGGVVVSLRDQYLPRQSYLDAILQKCEKANISVQLEVEGVGASDGKDVQLSATPMDWCFIGVAVDQMHTPFETVLKKDLLELPQAYLRLINEF